MLALHDLTVTTFRQMLGALQGQLHKAKAHAAAAGRDPDTLLGARLAPDMFPLEAQVRFACGLAVECFARLLGEPVERPGESASLGDASALIDRTLERLQQVDPQAVERAALRPVELALPGGPTFEFRGDEYVRDWALPQFYFHLLMSYALLRREGVPLGKADYVPHVSRYAREEDGPGAR